MGAFYKCDRCDGVSACERGEDAKPKGWFHFSMWDDKQEHQGEWVVCPQCAKRIKHAMTAALESKP